MLIARRFQAMLAIARGPFLLLTPAVLFPAAAVSFQLTGGLPLDLLLLIVVGALAAHVAVNALNEYQDFKSGLDNTTRRTPFSGGSGTLPDRPALLGTALWLFIGAFLLMVLIGAYLSWRVGPGILSLGLLGGLIIVAYTRLINRMPMACLVSPGVGFGLLMVNGTVYVLTGDFFAAGQSVGWAVFFLVNALLLLNQLPDIDADRAVGRRHFPVLLGVVASVRIYRLLLLGAYGSVVIGVVLGLLPWPALLALATLPLGLMITRDLLGSSGDIPAMVPALGKNVLLVLSTPVLLGIGILLG
ncbi:prenyltransferase [Porticoccus sp.]|uniref:prenyltransferase n=1 Tax=Porticoccus sp. TaxID=2024853 RepID=UPI003F69620B